MIIIKLVIESFRFAWNALKSNLLRTALSLLGVTVGIFAIIAVFTVVDSLERGVRQSLNFLGDKVIYVQKWPWSFGPEYPWWKYINRPMPVYEEYEYLAENLKNAEAVGILVGARTTAKYKSNSISGVDLVGISYSYKDISEIPVEDGRYFTPQEVQTGKSIVVIGSNLAETLFPRESAVGKEIKIKGLKYRVIGVMEKQGESLLDFNNNDDAAYVPFKAFQKAYYTGKYDGSQATIAVKGRDNDAGLMELEAEITGLMRRLRGLRPVQEPNFALNRPELLTSVVTNIFNVVTFVGAIIGSFSILIGGFGIANIMFVSVRERTNIIGIQKSLGAKNYFILWQFLFEAIFLSLFGGVFGILAVYSLAWLVDTFFPLGALELVLTFENVVWGLIISTVIGVISGLIPAWTASKLDPVIAIRTNG